MILIHHLQLLCSVLVSFYNNSSAPDRSRTERTQAGHRAVRVARLAGRKMASHPGVVATLSL